jgi:hypothetical protein
MVLLHITIFLPIGQIPQKGYCRVPEQTRRLAQTPTCVLQPVCLSQYQNPGLSTQQPAGPSPLREARPQTLAP